MKIIPAMRRRALILHYSGDTSSYLSGVRVDVNNIHKFLRCNCGGAWEDGEITIAPDNCSAEWLEKYFRDNILIDYYLIFFTGHGTYNEEKGGVYWLNEREGIYNTWIQDRIGENSSAMLISDSCQVIEKVQLGGILESRCFSAGNLESNREECRKLYNDALRKLPQGMFVTASSVSPGEEAAEDSRYGGYYMHSLLRNAQSIVEDTAFQNGIYGIAYIHQLASDEVEERSKGKQTPFIKGYTRSSQPPFVVKLVPKEECFNP